MAKIVSMHSFRRGTGKSGLTANIATLLAAGGRRVGLLDINLQSPSLHVLFGLKETDIPFHLNDYLWGTRTLDEIIYDLTPRITPRLKGQLFLIPASTRLIEIARTIREGYNVDLIHAIFQGYIKAKKLDILLVDTYAGLNETTLQAMALSDATAILLHLDHQNYQGTGILLGVARELGVGRIVIIVNEAASTFDAETIQTQVQATYDCEVAAVVPYSDTMMALSSASIFVLQYPHHPISAALRQAAARLAA
jgi:septum site-determining protein MinD